MTGFDAENERYIQGAMICYPDLLIKGMAELSQDLFSLREHRIVFDLLNGMYRNNEPVTPESVYRMHSAKIKDLGIRWASFTDVFANDGDFEVACKKLKNDAHGRMLLALAERIKKGLEANEDIETIIADTEKNMLECNTGLQRLYMSPKTLAIRCADEVAARMDNTKNKAIFTSFKRLNYFTGGFEDGDLIILSGGTGTGKSAFAMNLTCDIGIMQKIPCLYANSEMSEGQIALRITALLSGTSHRQLRNGNIETDTYGRIIQKLDLCNAGAIHTITIPDLRLDKVTIELRRFKAHEGIKVAIIDYVGRCDFLDAKNKDDWQVMTGAARKLKTLAQELEIVVIMLAQLNASGRLAQASYMSHEADLWLNLDKPNPGEIQEPWNMLLQIKKARNSITGEIPLYFCGDILTFTDNKNIAIELARKAG